VLATPSKPPT